MDMTTVAVVIYEDRHADVKVEVFLNEQDAVAKARAFALASARPDAPTETLTDDLTADMRADGWLYSGLYSDEGDSVRVVTVTVQG